MKPTEYLTSLYDRLGPPDLANFAPSDLCNETVYQFGAFVVADIDGQVVLVRRTPIAEYPGIEDYWWIPGGAREADEQLDQAAIREFREETGLGCSIQRTLLAQLAEDRPFIALFFRGSVVDGAISSDYDPDNTTAEARVFDQTIVPFDKLWTDSDKILLVHEGFTTGEVEHLITKNKLKGRHNKTDAAEGSNSCG